MTRAPKKNQSAADTALALARLASERKPLDLVIMDLRKVSSFTDFMIILSGRSTRQVSSIGDHIQRAARTELGLKTLGNEGSGQGNWILLDYGFVVIHVLLEQAREYYDLEGLWSDAPKYIWPEGENGPLDWPAT